MFIEGYFGWVGGFNVDDNCFLLFDVIDVDYDVEVY